MRVIFFFRPHQIIKKGGGGRNHTLSWFRRHFFFRRFQVPIVFGFQSFRIRVLYDRFFFQDNDFFSFPTQGFFGVFFGFGLCLFSFFFGFGFSLFGFFLCLGLQVHLYSFFPRKTLITAPDKEFPFSTSSRFLRHWFGDFFFCIWLFGVIVVFIFMRVIFFFRPHQITKEVGGGHILSGFRKLFFFRDFQVHIVFGFQSFRNRVLYNRIFFQDNGFFSFPTQGFFSFFFGFGFCLFSFFLCLGLGFFSFFL